MNTANFYQNLRKICLFSFIFSFLPIFGQDTIQPYDIIINEFMPDPSPKVGLPESEYIELYNRSTKILNLKDCELVNGSVSTKLPNFSLKSKHFVTIYGKKKDISFNIYGETVEVEKLILISNPGDTFYLKSSTGMVVDAASFDLSFYQNSKKSNGGWSLERIHPDAPCLLQNWLASNDLKGGTPSAMNSVQNPNSVQNAPEILGFNLKNVNTISVKFDRAMDRKSMTSPPQYFIDNGLIIKGLIKSHEPLFDGVDISFNTSFKKNETYNFIVKNTVKDCQMTPLVKNDTFRFQLPEKPKKQEVLINEILINPEAGGSRFIELYNNSDKFFDISDFKIADLTKGNVKEVQHVSSNFLLFPRKYVVLTDNPSYIQKRYKVENYKKNIVKTHLPTWSDKEGTVVIYRFEGNSDIVLDSFSYSKNFHNPLLANTEGVSLERISFENLKNDAQNWQSAAAATGYATPAYQNSQYLPPSVFEPKNAVFTIETPSFSPDGDGFQEVFSMTYKMDSEGYIGSFFIFDIHGKLIKTLKINELLSLEGKLIWAGEDDKNLAALSGVYIVYAHLISPTGGKKMWKKAFTLTNK